MAICVRITRFVCVQACVCITAPTTAVGKPMSRSGPTHSMCRGRDSGVAMFESLRIAPADTRAAVALALEGAFDVEQGTVHGINFASWEDTASVTVPSIVQLARPVASTPHPFNNVGTGKINSIARGVGSRAAATLYRGLMGPAHTPFVVWLPQAEERQHVWQPRIGSSRHRLQLPEDACTANAE